VTDAALSPAGRAEGERRRDASLALLAERRTAVVRAGQRALLLRLLSGADTATADDVCDAVPLPPGIGPRCYGAVPLPLADAGIITHAGYTPTRRPEAHARPVAVWTLADRAAALAWLTAHSPLPDPERPRRSSAIYGTDTFSSKGKTTYDQKIQPLID
jgi:hypothetical protein